MKESGKPRIWYKDKVIKQIVKASLTDDECAVFGQFQARFAFVCDRIEQKMLQETNRVLSGESSSTHELERSRKMLAALKDAEQKLKNP
jgi:hypothetical protein